MKKLILLALFAASSLFGTPNLPNRHIIHIYRDVVDSSHLSNALIQSMFICGVWAAKFDVYNFNHFELHDIAIFRAYNYECAFMVRFNRKTHMCMIEFCAHEEGFDYPNFKKIMDSVFLWS